ncbi:hypothetical protein BDN70DRAFT_992226 [Pholiota conissans]|uniref:ditrans,polycis-polyprenyl diphosphate synthase [(2E,6E)-farnesyldiphosphate specific] n=1 Tax=Pholiota conissans TaxID=109636 RepID=A0A9P6D2S9_9AGAR|nr:hypothetical protein BDN70DRAFT_992226 [Pholiota conissans]
MSAVYAFILYFLHLLYAVILGARSLKKRLFASPPQQLQAQRRRIPKHLAIVFTVDPLVPVEIAREALTESIINAVEWCRTIGVKKLTVYEENDMLSGCVQAICKHLPVQEQETDSSESEIDYPLTPPPSDHSESRPLSPNDLPLSSNYIPITKLRVSESFSEKSTQNESHKLLKRRHLQKTTEGSQKKADLLLCVISSEASKPAIAAVAQALADRERRQLYSNSSASTTTKRPFKLTVEELDEILEDDGGLSSPDFMIIHSLDYSYSSPAPTELHGFPPWHIRLTEIFQNHPRDSRSQPLFQWRRPCLPIPLDELGFREALDEFASAEMRFGK